MLKKLSKKSLTVKLDKLFSEVVRMVGWCERCHKKQGEAQLQCAHIYSRRFRHVRWNNLNAVCLCASCHFWAHQRPLDFAKWVEEYLGVGTLSEIKEKSLRIDPVTLEDMQNIHDSLLEVKSRG